MRFHEIHLLVSDGELAFGARSGLGTGHRRELGAEVDSEYDADDKADDGEPYRD
jgi:hypothetical protein